MKNILGNVSEVPKRLVLAGAAFVLSFATVLTPLAQQVSATNNVDIEGTVQVANVTDGDTGYSDSVNAGVDELVKVQVWYHNRENFDSGKIAKNLRVALDVPQTQGKQQTIGATIKGDNTNTVADSANVNLSLDNAYLDYVEGSAKWRYNKKAKHGTEEEKKACQTEDQQAPASCYVTAGSNPEEEGVDELLENGDAIVNGGKVLEDLRPCFAYEATVTVLMRVKASEVKVNKYVSEHDGDRNVKNNDWKVKNSAKPGDKLDYMIKFENKGNTVLEDVAVGDNLPDYMEYVPGSTYIINGNNPNGVDAGTDNVYKGGIDVGDYNPGAAGYVIFTVKINESNVFEHCGVYTLKNVGVVRPKGMNEFFNTAWTNVDIVCAEGEQPKPEQPEQPEKPGEEQPEVPEELPETGPVSILAGLFGTSALAYGAHTWIASRRRLSSFFNQ